MRLGALEGQGQVQGHEVRYPLADVLSRFYGGPVGEGYTFEVRTGDDGREIHLFGRSGDQDYHFKLVPRQRGVFAHETGWDLVHAGTGRVVAQNLHYVPQEQRFYVVGNVKPEDFLNQLNFVISEVKKASSSKDVSGQGEEIRIPMMVRVMPLEEDTFLGVGLDNHYYVLKRDGDEYRVLSRMDRSDFHRFLMGGQLQQSNQQAGQSDPFKFWEFILPLLLILLTRRGG